jgi:hypothetical protein
MRKLLFFAAVASAAIVAACGGKDDDSKTTLIIKSDATKQIVAMNYQDVVSGYIDNDGGFKKIAEHGTLLSGGQTREVTLDDVIDSVCISTMNVFQQATIMSDIVPIVKNQKNIIIIEDVLY